MINESDRLLKILLSNGTAVNMFASPESLKKLSCHPRFVVLKDTGNDNICLSVDSITGFEVLDERTDEPVKESIYSTEQVPELLAREEG